MAVIERLRLTLVISVLAGIGLIGGRAYTQGTMAPVNDLPNPYRLIDDWAGLPEGRTWGASASIQVDRDGRSIWVAERCGANSCAGSSLAPILKFDASGKLVKSFGAGVFVGGHGIFVDTEGNVWLADHQGNKEGTKGHQVFKFSPDGKILMTLGKAGVAGQGPDTFDQPCDVAIAPNGDIFVGDGHGGQGAGATPATTSRIVKFSKDGKFIKSWGKWGSGPGELKTPHSLYFDSRGRLFVADRGNNRIQIFDQEGTFLEEWKQFSRPSSIYIDANDTIYVSDSESSTTSNPGGWRRGIRIGSAKDGKVTSFIPDRVWTYPTAPAGGMEGVAADAAGNVYGTNVWPNSIPIGQLNRYVKR
jgi:streptogramin lyase